MKDKFLESIRTGFINQIEEIISETKLSSEENELNAVDTLVLVNNNISSWISSINGIINVDEELLTKVAELKRPFVSAAKKEVALEVSKIIENESTDITSKISNFMNELKKKGLDLDGDNKKSDNRTTTPAIQSTKTSVYDSVFGASKQQVLKREIEKPRRNTSYCPPESCGGSSGCGGGGC